MRMWMVDPMFMCNQHLLGEHAELHKHLHNFAKHHSMTGRILNNCCEPSAYAKRHDELAKEMLRRGMVHRSPLQQPDISYLPRHERIHKINVPQNAHLLVRRCRQCRSRFNTLMKEGVCVSG